MVDGIHAENITQWFEANIKGVTPPLSFSLIAGGHSNLTYKVVDAKNRRMYCGARRWVMCLRAPMIWGGEYRIIAALGPTTYRWPRPWSVYGQKCKRGGFLCNAGLSTAPYMRTPWMSRICPKRAKEFGISCHGYPYPSSSHQPGRGWIGDSGKKGRLCGPAGPAVVQTMGKLQNGGYPGDGTTSAVC